MDRALYFALVPFISGCMINPIYLPSGYSTARLADGRLEIAMSSDKYKELGGEGSDKLNALVGEILSKEGMCPHGFTTTVGFSRYVSVVAKCKSPTA